jgi:hypothetical protein
MKRLRMKLLVMLGVLAVTCVGRATAEQTQGDSDLLERVLRAQYNGAHWGNSSNGIQFGVSLSSVGPGISNAYKVFTYLYNSNSNRVYGTLEPPHGQRLDMVLKDAAGKEVPQTKFGASLSKSLVPGLHTEFNNCVLQSGVLFHYDTSFDLRDAFKINQPGTFVLTIKPRLYRLTEYPNRVPFPVPEVSISLTLTKDDLER